ncbi:MAG: DUF3293 domain-containing protein [Deinococcales bacterium]
MTPNQILREAYLATSYHAAGVAIQLSSRPTGVRLFDGRKFAFISAQNPRSTPLSEDENLARNAMLATVLIAKGWEYGSSFGHNTDLSWSEAGFVVWDVDLAEIAQVAKDFEQNAILYGQDEKIALHWCFSRVTEWFYPVVSRSDRGLCQQASG